MPSVRHRIDLAKIAKETSASSDAIRPNMKTKGAYTVNRDFF
jgi:hypothetical protein